MQVTSPVRLVSAQRWVSSSQPAELRRRRAAILHHDLGGAAKGAIVIDAGRARGQQGVGVRKAHQQASLASRSTAVTRAGWPEGCAGDTS